ncbi:MAG: tetratricopeptide repeat protein, partial [Myxococcales bacterium]|nr:tetratricopeptide repeat protein [Myxococcales bacterium]
ASAWLPAADGARCGGGAAHLAGIWDSARKAEIGGAIAASGVGYAEETWTLAQRRLDSYAEQWLKAYNRACLGHQAGDTSDELYDRQIACLDGRLLELEATSKVLAEIDASALPQVNELIALLPPIDTCTDTEALRERFAPPADARQARAVDNIRRDLTEVRAKNNAGYHREVHEDAKALVLAARESGYRPVLAEALYEYGEVLYGEHRHPEAEPIYLEALLTADGVRHDDIAARAGTRLVFNLGWYQSRAEEALIRAQHVRTILERLGPGHVAEAELENALGAIAYAKADYAEARQHFERGKALTESLTLERPPWIRFFILLNLGEICEAQGDIPCMEQSTAKALAEVEAEYGADHPRISYFLLRMARARVSQGRIDDARALLQRMIEHSAATFGEDHPQHGMTVWQASGVLLWAGKLAESQALFDRLGPPDDPKVDHDVWFHLRRSELQELHGDLKGALTSVEAATAGREPGEDASPRVMQMTRNRHSYLLNRHGRYAEAAALAEAALVEVEKTYGADHPDISAPLTNLARAKIGSGEFDVAADHLARALAVVEERAPEHWKLLDPLEAKAELALELGEPEVALEAARRALKILSKHACVPHRKASFGLQLARAQVAAGRDRDEVMATIDEALAHAEAVDGANAIKGKIDAWLAGYRATAGADLTPDLDAKG